MNVSNKQYAQTLFELTQKESEGNLDDVIKKFAELLRKDKRLRDVDDIIKKFDDICNKENGVIEAEIITKESLKNDLKDRLREFIKDRYRAKKVILKNRTDENIKGGIIIKVNDEILDGSVVRRLRELKKAIE